ncbi:hypothetical protein NQ315_017342 [Exocentrus adspersus]|uniref:Uncharacterized protein n=1 Tax=Exocentrus adspersus TaxID=1586481 RepID=A0AAV8VDP8_9CUCU|nr:hypothetical protein NQ315_017342 [Exocentrus adspersus]
MDELITLPLQPLQLVDERRPGRTRSDGNRTGRRYAVNSRARIFLSISYNKRGKRCLNIRNNPVHHIGKNSVQNNTRPIRITFVSSIKRDTCENLTRTQYDLQAAKDKKYGNRNTWMMGGKVYIKKNKDKHMISTIQDLDT